MAQTEIDYMEYANDAAAQAAYVSNTTIANPISQWKMNDNAADYLVDDVMGAHDGTSVNYTNTMNVAGKINTALNFNGSTDKISFAASSIAVTSFSVSMWVKPTSAPATGQANIWHPSAKDWWLRYNTDKQMQIYLKDTAASYLDISPVAICDTGVWSHIVFMYDGVAKKGRSYLNTVVREVDWDKTFNNIDLGTSYPLCEIIGTYRYTGAIDDIRLYNFALTANEVLEIYNNGTGTENQNPVGALMAFSETTIKTQGSYALKGIAAITASLNKTLTKTF
jgi:hypothetical protein